MKKPILIMLSVSMLLAVQASAAGEVTGLTSFSAGTPARASEVNANFDAVEAAVDNNHARLTSVEAGKQNRVTETCAAGSAIRAINADGTVSCQASTSSGGDITGVMAATGLSGGGAMGDVTLSVDTNVIQSRVAGSCGPGSAIRVIGTDGRVACEVDDDTNTTYTVGTGLSLSGTTMSIAPGSVSVHGSAFMQWRDSIGCIQSRDITYMHYTAGTGGSCTALASLTLPDGATLGTLSCLAYDNSTVSGFTSYVNVRLYRIDLSTGLFDSILGLGTGTDSPNLQTLVAAIPSGKNAVDNNNFAYVLYAWFGNADLSTVGNNLRLYGCKIGYQP